MSFSKSGTFSFTGAWSVRIDITHKIIKSFNNHFSDLSKELYNLFFILRELVRIYKKPPVGWCAGRIFSCPSVHFK